MLYSLIKSINVITGAGRECYVEQNWNQRGKYQLYVEYINITYDFNTGWSTVP